MPRQIPTQSTSNLRSASATVRASISGQSGAIADALTAIAGALDQAQAAIEALESKNRELASPDVVDRNSTAYVSGDRIVGGVSVQGGLRSLAGQSLDLTLENQVATISAKDHDTGNALELDISATDIRITAPVGMGLLLSNGAFIRQKNVAGAVRNLLTHYTDDTVYLDNPDGPISVRPTGRTINSAPVALAPYTVATLPTGLRGDTAYVTDALGPAFLAIIVGGGAIATPVFFNGTNWVAF